MQAQNKLYGMFIGRKSQFQELARIISNDLDRLVVSIQGDGGVGKTFLLNEIFRRYSTQTDILCFRVVDFYQIKTRKFLWILEILAAQAPDYFRDYYHTKQEQSAANIEAQTHLVTENDIINAFYRDLELLEQRYRCIFLFDTVELIQETVILDILELVKVSKKGVFVLAGRRNAELDPEFTRLLGHKAVHSMQLSGFPEHDAIEYIRQIPAGLELTADDQQKLYLLSNNGVPVKLALALDWLSRGWAMSTLLEYSYEELVQSRDSDRVLYQQAVVAFERELVTHFGRLGTDIDRVINTMAHVNKRFNRELMRILLPGIGDELILEKIGALPFVKVIEDDFYVLHDEVQRIIVKRIWEQSDPIGDIRREISSKVVLYYDMRLDNLRTQQPSNPEYESDIWIFRIEQLYYQLDLNLVDGYRSFTVIFDELKDRRNLGEIELAALALDILLKDRTLPVRLQYFANTYYSGWILVRRTNYLNQALECLERGLNLLMAKSTTVAPLTEGRIFLEREVDQRIGEIYTLLGYTHRRLGNWDEAVEYYEQARKLNEEQIDALKTADSPDQSIIQRSTATGRLAETLNDIANLQRMRGDLDTARLYCKTSLMIRRGLGEQRKVGHCCYVMSMIMWELGNTSEAMHYLQQAREQYQVTKATVLENVWVDRYEGYISFRTGNLAEAFRLTKLALDTADSEHQQEERAQAHIILSRIYRAKGMLVDSEQALRHAEEALAIATIEHNDFIIAESYLTICLTIKSVLEIQPEVDSAGELRLRFVECLKAGRDLTMKRRYSRQLILFNELMAETIFEQKNYLEAFEIYLQNWHEALKFKPSVFGRSLIRPLRLLHRLVKDDVDQALSVCEMISEHWIDESILDENYAGLKNEVQYVHEVAQAAIDRRSQELDFNQQFRQGSWQKALRICSELEQVPIYYHPTLADVLHHRAELYHSANLFSLAKIFCERASRIRLEYESLVGHRPVGDSYLLLSQIYWKLGMTSEAAEALDLSERAYQNADWIVGLGLIHLERGLMAFRVHYLDKAKESFGKAQAIFEQTNETIYLAQTLNVLGRLVRVDTRHMEYAEIRFREAARRGVEALRVLSDRDWFVAAEIHLTLCILHYSWGIKLSREGKATDANQHFDQADIHNREGWRKIEPLDTPVLFSVYRGMQANLFLQRGDKERSRLHFFDELVYSTKTKHMRLIRALDLLEDLLMTETPLEVEQDVDWFINSWRAKGFAESFPQVEQSLLWIASHRRFFPEQPLAFEPTAF